MPDAETRGQDLVGVAEDGPRIRPLPDDQVGAQGDEPRGDRPDVEVMDGQNARDRPQGLLQGFGVDVGRARPP